MLEHTMHHFLSPATLGWWSYDWKTNVKMAFITVNQSNQLCTSKDTASQVGGPFFSALGLNIIISHVVNVLGHIETGFKGPHP